MFQQNSLQKLYPHLKFDRIPQAGRERSVSIGRATMVPKEPVYQAEPKPPEELKEKLAPQKVIEKKPEPPIDQPPVTKIETKAETKSQKNGEPRIPVNPEQIKPEKKAKSVKIKEEGVKGVAKQIPKVPPKTAPVRKSQIPVKGERGLQSKYTLEQKREMYLNQLSRKSVKRAEQEVAKVNEVLRSVDHDPVKLKGEEKKIKGQLKLINVAKYFAGLDNIKNEQNSSQTAKETFNTGSDMSDESERPEMSGSPKREPITGRNRGRRSGSKCTSERVQHHEHIGHQNSSRCSDAASDRSETEIDSDSD